MRFDYYIIRPCIELDVTVKEPNGGLVEQRQLTSYVDKAEFLHKGRWLNEASIPHETFWTIYGMTEDAHGEIAAALGDFTTEADAFEMLDGILAPMRAALDLIGENTDKACAILQDAITLSTQRTQF
jgi:hypothetical protein